MSRLLFLLVYLGFLSMVVRAQQAPICTPGESTDEAVESASLHLKLGERGECRSVLAGVIHAQPSCVEALRLLGRLELSEEHPAEAVVAADQALATMPDDVECTLIKATALRSQSREVDVSHLLNQVPATERERWREDFPVLNEDTVQGSLPTPPQAEPSAEERLLEEASECLRSGRLEEAGRLTERLRQHWPHNREAKALRAQYLTESGHAAEAVDLLETLRGPQGADFPELPDLAYAYLETGRAESAKTAFRTVAGSAHYTSLDRRNARQALSEMNHDEQVTEAEKALATGRSAEALDLLLPMKAKQPAGRRFDSQLDLAAAHTAQGHYAEATRACDEVLAAEAGIYKDDERRDAMEQLAALHELTATTVDAAGTYGRLEEGTLWRANMGFSTPVSPSTRLLADTGWDFISLSDEPLRGTQERFSASAGVQYAITPNWSSTVTVGGYADSVLASAAATYTMDNGSTYTLSAAYREAARDTLLLEALDGRQDSVVASMCQPFGHHFALEAAGTLRQVSIDDINIGQGAGLDAQVRWHPWTLSKDIYVAYAAELSHFSGKAGAFDRATRPTLGDDTPDVRDAVPDRINRHALQAHAAMPLLPKLTAGATGEAAWRQETGDAEFGAGAEVIWSPTKLANLHLNADYATGGAGPNAGSEVLLLSMGVKLAW